MIYINGVAKPKLSDLNIDAHKDWAAKKIENLGAPDSGDDAKRHDSAPEAHKTSHENGGADEISVAGLSGVLADDQPANLLDRYIEIILWVSLDGLTAAGDGSATAKGNIVTINSGAALNNKHNLYITAAYGKICESGKLLTVEFLVKRFSHNTDQAIWLLMTSDPTGDITAFNDHFAGFNISDADLYAQSCQGSVGSLKGTDTGIDITAATQWLRLKFVLNRGTDCKFYVNDVLKATHASDKIPNLDDLYWRAEVKTQETVAHEIDLGRTIITKAY